MVSETLKRINAGDMSAFGALYDLSYERIYRFVYHRVMNTMDAEDIVAESFMKALKRISSFHGHTEGEFFSWMYRIAYTTIVDRARSKKEVDPLEPTEHDPSVSSHIESNIHDEMTLEKVLAFLETLPERDKTILTMRIWDDLSYDEISEITGESISNAKKIVSRTLEKITANVSYLFIFSFLISHVYSR